MNIQITWRYCASTIEEACSDTDNAFGFGIGARRGSGGTNGGSIHDDDRTTSQQRDPTRQAEQTNSKDGKSTRDPLISPTADISPFIKNETIDPQQNYYKTIVFFKL